MNWLALADGPSAVIVIGGTLLATLLRCGWGDCRLALARVAQLPGRAFAADRVRSELAVQVQEIRQDGLLRAPSHRFDDREFDEATDALLHDRSLAALLARHEAHRERRTAAAQRAGCTLAQAAELAPVFGLAGTLVSLSQLPGQGLAPGSLSGAISMAVVTTLYGVLLANLVLAPLARMVERKAQVEELERQALVDWLAGQVGGLCRAPDVAQPGTDAATRRAAA